MSGWMLVIQLGLLNGLILAWAVIGFASSFRLFNFADLTVETSLPLGAGIFASLVSHGHSLLLSMAAGVAAGALAGAVTASLHVWLHLNKLLAGVIIVAIGYSTSLALMGAPNIGLLSRAYLFGGLGEGATLFFLLFGTLLFFGLLLLFLSSRYGLRMRAAGSNRDFAASLGISPGPRIIYAVAAANALAAASGILLTSYQGFADVGMGQGTLVMALAALGIGEVFIRPGRVPPYVAVLSAALVGSVIYQCVLAAALHFGLPATDLKLATGVLVLGIVAIRAWRSPRPLWQEALGE
jgi:putative ABC transport system permease protein